MDHKKLLKEMMDEHDPVGSKDAVIVLRRIHGDRIPLSSLFHAHDIIKAQPGSGSVTDMINMLEIDMINRLMSWLKAYLALRILRNKISVNTGNGEV